VKKILIHSIAFSPDGVSTAYLYNDIALKFKKSGFEVVVLTTTPHYNALPELLKRQPLKVKWGGLYYESDFHGIQVKHVPQRKFKQALLRIAGFLYWHVLAFFIGLFEKNVAIILSPSPPLTIGFINILLGKLKGSKVVYNVQEIYPDFLIEQGGLTSKPIISVLKWLERFVYNKSDAVTTIDPVFYATIAGRFNEQNKLHIIPNFVDTTLYTPLNRNNLTIDRALFPDNPSTLKLMYAGNIGLAQDWEPLIKTAIEIRDLPIEIFIIGEGVMKNYIRDEIKKHNLDNIHLLQYQPREQMPSLIAYADLHFIFMSPRMEGHGFPSKVYTIMACAKSLIVCSGENTPIYKFLDELACSYLITEKDVKCKVQKIVDLLKSITKENLELKGKLGFQEIEARYSNDAVTQQYVDLANKLVGNG
jgi:colanic acid biosynthesis glycosyl transferase WcaI